jgi:hypothetical protein
MLSYRERKARTLRRKRDSVPWLTNAWPRSFFAHHPLTGKDDVPAVEARNQISGFQDKLTNFLQESTDLGFPSEADEVKRYCGNVSLKDIEAGVGDAGIRRALWIDDRKNDLLSGCGSPRLSNGWMTAAEGLRYLGQPVWLARTPPSFAWPIC